MNPSIIVIPKLINTTDKNIICMVPRRLMQYIFDMFDMSSQYKFRRTCKQFRSLVIKKMTTATLNMLTANPKVEYIDNKSLISLSEISKLPLKHLKLYMPINSNLPVTLESLEILGTQYNTYDLSQLSLKKLSVLNDNFIYPTSLTSLGTIRIECDISYLTNLKTLKIRKFFGTPKILPEITSLKISNSKMSFGNMKLTNLHIYKSAFIGYLPITLTSLSLYKCQNLNTLIDFSYLTCLRELKIDDDNNMVTRYPKSLTSLSAQNCSMRDLTYLSNLTKLTIRRLSQEDISLPRSLLYLNFGAKKYINNFEELVHLHTLKIVDIYAYPVSLKKLTITCDISYKISLDYLNNLTYLKIRLINGAIFPKSLETLIANGTYDIKKTNIMQLVNLHTIDVSAKWLPEITEKLKLQKIYTNTQSKYINEDELHDYITENYRYL